MLSLQKIRTEPDFIKERLQVKNFKDLQVVDEILAIDVERRAIQTNMENMKAQMNVISKEIGALMSQGNKEEAEKKKSETSSLKESIAELTINFDKLEAVQHDLLLRLPNLPCDLVPSGVSAEDNVVVRETSLPAYSASMLPHWELAQKYDIIDFELGTKVTGAGFPFYKNKGAKLQRAMIQYFLDKASAAGYTEYQAPLMVNTDSAYGTGQLPDKEGQMYHMQVDDFYMIPTAEVPLTNIYRDVIANEKDLPIKLCGYTPCFRREAGSYGKDVRGLNRLHQFDKVEIVQLCRGENSYATLDTMVAHVESLVQELELPYRILRLCGGDMSFASALTYDFEVYSTAQQRWLEVSSVSNFETFQTNRLKFRYKDAEGKNQLGHSLNGSALALPRILAAILENYQDADGIRIPKVLQAYTGFDRIS